MTIRVFNSKETALPSEFRVRIEAIKNDFANGSTVIARNTLKLLTDAVNYIDESNKKIILDLAVELLSSKPHMTAPTNILNIFINEYPGFSTKSEMVNFLIKLESGLNLASDSCVALANDKLFKKEKTSILTCSYSSTVYNIISKTNSDIIVYVLQSIWNGIDYSEIWRAQLKVLNIKCYVLSEDDIIPEIDFGLLGADAVLYSGDVLNGAPSLYLAQSLKKIGIPLLVVAESFKKCKESPISDGFELIPAGLITEIITDNIRDTFKFNKK